MAWPATLVVAVRPETTYVVRLSRYECHRVRVLSSYLSRIPRAYLEYTSIPAPRAYGRLDAYRYPYSLTESHIDTRYSVFASGGTEREAREAGSGAVRCILAVASG